MSQHLFYPGSSSLTDIARQLKYYLKLIGEDHTVVARTLLAKTHQKEWGHYYTTVHFLPSGELLQLKDFHSDQVQLKEGHFDPLELLDTDPPFSSLASWWKEQERSQVLQFNGFVSVRHMDSHNNWCVEPCWLIQLNQVIGSNQGMITVPDAHFFSSKDRFFSLSIGGLASRWMANPELLQRNTLGNDYCVVVPDRRFWIKDSKLEGEKLTICTDGKVSHDRHYAIRYTDKWNTTKEIVDDFASSSIDVQIERSFKRIDIYLLLGTEITDHFHENEFSSTWGRSILQPDRAFGDKAFANLDEALNLGETDQIEFKEWIEARTRDGKTKELLNTASGFSNLKGGYVYIGVSDGAEVIGILNHLHRTYGEATGGVLDSMVGMYIDDLKKLLREGIQRSIHPVIDAIPFSSHVVIRVHIPEGKEKPYSLTENGEIFVRAGATTRRPRPADAYLIPKGLPTETPT